MKKYDYTSDDKQNLDFNQIHNIDLGKFLVIVKRVSNIRFTFNTNVG